MTARWLTNDNDHRRVTSRLPGHVRRGRRRRRRRSLLHGVPPSFPLVIALFRLFGRSPVPDWFQNHNSRRVASAAAHPPRRRRRRRRLLLTLPFGYGTSRFLPFSV